MSPASDGATTQLLVLGGGPGGYTAAFRAADLGLEVTLVERYPILGGVCTNVGCIPSKALLHAAKVITEAQAFADHGVRFGRPEIDLARLQAWKQGVVGRLTRGIAAMAKSRGVTVRQGTGRFAGPRLLQVEGPGGTQQLAFEQAIVAVGSRPSQLPGLDLDDPRLLDSTGALALSEVPARLLVVGGGIIGLELACVYDALGCRVSVVEMLDRLIPEADGDLVKPLHKRLASRYEAIHLETRVAGLEPTPEGLRARFEGKAAPALFDRVLVAVGRRPNGDRIAAEQAGLKLDERGFLPVDRQQRTNLPHVFAVGDVARPPLLAHKAMHEAKVAAEVAAGEKSAFDARVIPSVAYTDPEVAWVGLTEREAKARGIAYEKAAFPWSASGRSLSLGRDEGTTKLLIDPATERILGAGAVGPNAGDLISEAGLAIEMDCVAGDLALTIHPHPTLSETLGLAAEVFEGTVTDLYKPRRQSKPSA
jgi:dihydrolipoamide dehydrogenase